MSQRKSIDEFIKQSKKVHGKKYDYSQTNYIDWRTPVEISCKKHGIFFQIPNNHISHKRGCPQCNGGVKKSINDYLGRFKNAHGEKYDYSKIVYKNSRTPVKIICPVHGVFKQRPDVHANGGTCRKCYFYSRALRPDEFISKSVAVHKGKYIYNNVKYKNSRSLIKIICPKHGLFIQRADTHLAGMGCPSCWKSKGEMVIEDFLKRHRITFTKQKRFNGCRLKRMLPFDFYLPRYNVCIEYDGMQHFESIKYFGGEPKLVISKLRDKIKTKFCRKNRIHLLRISYKENIIQSLKKFFKNELQDNHRRTSL